MNINQFWAENLWGDSAKDIKSVKVCDVPGEFLHRFVWTYLISITTCCERLPFWFNHKWWTPVSLLIKKLKMNVEDHFKLVVRLIERCHNGGRVYEHALLWRNKVVLAITSSCMDEFCNKLKHSSP